MDTDNIVMWGILLNNADWDCFKTLILQETWKTRSQHQEEFYAFSEVARSCQEVGCARNRLLFHTVLQKLKYSLSLSMHVYAWMGVIEVFRSSPNQTNKTKDVREPRGNLSATPQSNLRKQIPTTNTNPDLTNVDHVPSRGTHSDALHTGGGWIGDMLVADWEEPEKCVASEFMSKDSIPRLCKSTSVEGNSGFHLQTDRSNKKDHVVPRSLRLRFLWQEDQNAGGDPNAERQIIRKRCISTHRTQRSGVERTILGAFQPTSDASLTWHFAASCTYPVKRRSR